MANQPKTTAHTESAEHTHETHEDFGKILATIKESIGTIREIPGLWMIVLATFILWVFHKDSAEDILRSIWEIGRQGTGYAAGAVKKASRSLTGRALAGYDAVTIRLDLFFSPIRLARWRISLGLYALTAVIWLGLGFYWHGNYQVSLFKQNLGDILFIISVVMILTPLTILLWVKKTIAGLNHNLLQKA